MENVEMKVTGNTLTITVDISKRLGRSRSGKTTIVGTTSGIVNVPGSDVLIGLNVFVK